MKNSNHPNFSRSVVSSKGEKRKERKFSMTDSEYQLVKRRCQEWGYKKPRDMIIDFCRAESPVDAAIQNEHTKFAIRLSTLATCVNKIDAGIDVENSYHKLLEEVKALCLNYRL